MIDALYHLDPVTGLLDRSSTLLMADELAKRCNPDHPVHPPWARDPTGGRLGPLAVLWIDIDRFKQINDSFGHEVGDGVIATLAQRLRERLGGRGELGRMGADEFVCLAPGLRALQAEALAAEMAQAIGHVLELTDMALRLTAGIGIAVQQSGDSGIDLLQRADLAKTAAKRAGGSRVVVDGPDSGHSPSAQLQREELVIEQLLHEALAHGGLLLHFQPITDADGEVRVVEALLRCADPSAPGPSRFIPVAEKTGLIVRLGEWTLMQGCFFARRMREAGTPLKVAVNVSRTQLLDDQFSIALNAALLCTRVDAQALELELTESLFMDISPEVQSSLAAARELGVGLAIDDFGTGYSCLANLKDIPATKLKLDRAFVRALPEDARALAVVGAMTQLGQALGMTVTAEGAETPQQMDSLWACGVDQVQGFAIAEPMPEHELVAWLKQRRGAA